MPCAAAEKPGPTDGRYRGELDLAASAGAQGRTHAPELFGTGIAAYAASTGAHQAWTAIHPEFSLLSPIGNGQGAEMVQLSILIDREEDRSGAQLVSQ